MQELYNSIKESIDKIECGQCKFSTGDKKICYCILFDTIATERAKKCIEIFGE